MDLSRHLPVKAQHLNILIVLAERDHHGYSLMQALQALPNAIPVRTGPLYRSLRQLLELGLIDERDAPPPGVTDDARRGSYYRLSRLGRRVVEAELARLKTVLSMGQRLGLAKGRSA